MYDPGEPFRLEELAPGVHAAIATPRGFGLCNAGIVDLGEATLVFDAMLTPQAGAELGRAASRLTGSSVAFVVNSHYHGDHVRGTAAVGAAHVVSTARVRELVVERAPLHLRSDRAEARRDLERLRSGALRVGPVERVVYEGWFEGILATPEDLEFRPPDLTFASELTIHGRRRSARLVSFGGGHSPSDVLLYLPDERIAFLGDLLSVGYHPSLSDGNPEELVRILDETRTLGAERLVPGHGPAAGPEALERMRGYVSGLLGAARVARERGLSAEAFADAPPVAPFDRWAFSLIYQENARFVHGWAARPAAPRAPPDGRG